MVHRNYSEALGAQIRQVALDEIRHPTWEITKQFFSVSRLHLTDEIPVIEDIIIDENGAAVYFPVLDEDYYFVIYENIVDETASLRGMDMSAGSKVYLRISTDDDRAKALLAKLEKEIAAQISHDPLNKSYRSLLFHENRWLEYSHDVRHTGEVEDKLRELVDFLLPWRPLFDELLHIAHGYVTIAYEGCKYAMWGIALEQDSVEKLAHLHLAVDIDLYAGGPDLPDP